MSKLTALYRFYDGADTLLYVGITEDISARFSAHRASKPWWADVTRHTIEWRPSREEAEAAEKLAIIAERPVWNVRDSPWAPEPEIALHVREALEAGDAITTADARANLTEATQRVRLMGRCMYLVKRNKAVAALVPIELGELVLKAGGPDAAIDLLAKALAD